MPGNSAMSCANTEAASVAVTMTKRVAGGHAALRGAICTWQIVRTPSSPLLCACQHVILLLEDCYSMQ